MAASPVVRPKNESLGKIWENHEVAASVKLTMKALKDYLGLKSSSQRERLRFIGSRFGSMVSHNIPSADNAEKLLEDIRVFWTANGLGEMELSKEEPLAFTIRNCYDCVAAQAGDTLCAFKEGFIMAIFEEKLAGIGSVEETECCGTGADRCKFRINLSQDT